MGFLDPKPPTRAELKSTIVGFVDGSRTYDAQGRLATKTVSGTTFTYAYDAQGRVSSKTGGGKTVTYTYDAQGRIESQEVSA